MDSLSSKKWITVQSRRRHRSHSGYWFMERIRWNIGSVNEIWQWYSTCVARGRHSAVLSCPSTQLQVSNYWCEQTSAIPDDCVNCLLLLVGRHECPRCAPGPQTPICLSDRQKTRFASRLRCWLLAFHESTNLTRMEILSFSFILSVIKFSLNWQFSIATSLDDSENQFEFEMRVRFCNVRSQVSLSCSTSVSVSWMKDICCAQNHISLLKCIDSQVAYFPSKIALGRFL